MQQAVEHKHGECEKIVTQGIKIVRIMWTLQIKNNPLCVILKKKKKDK